MKAVDIINILIIWHLYQSHRLSVDNDLSLLEVAAVFFIHQDQVDGVLDLKAVMDILVSRGKLHAVHIHADGHEFTLVRAAIHDFVFDQVFGLGLGGGACPEYFFADQVDLHEPDL